jgi:uncharacterized protein (DUF697 family)/tellurite resistance protein
MTPEQTRALVTVALMAAFADGLKDERERARIKSLAQRLSAEGLDVDAIYEDVLLRKPQLASVAAPLVDDRNLALYAYEIAVGVADADGVHTSAEGAFLDALRDTLRLPAAETKRTIDEADAIAAAPSAPSARGTVAPTADQAQIDKRILDASITNAALELLPETLASMAILPLQVRMVYRIGQAHGFELDQGHIKEFIATLGVGLTGQYVEQFGRKLFGGLLGGLGGGLGRMVGRQAASSGLTFATTYAIGRVAQRYYAGGRTLDAQTLKQTFSALLDEARGLAPQYQAQIQQAARTIDTRNLVSLVKQV